MAHAAQPGPRRSQRGMSHAPDRVEYGRLASFLPHTVVFPRRRALPITAPGRTPPSKSARSPKSKPRAKAPGGRTTRVKTNGKDHAAAAPRSRGDRHQMGLFDAQAAAEPAPREAAAPVKERATPPPKNRGAKGGGAK